jgi:hypothetical protein
MDHLARLKSELQELEKNFEPDYPGQLDEIRRNLIVQRAVESADEILCELSDGSAEELDYLTMRFGFRFSEKIQTTLGSKLLAHDLTGRSK